MHYSFSVKIRKEKSGFTLIEILLYVAFFSLLSLIALSTLFQTIKAFTDLRISREINDSSVVIMERLTRDIKSATEVDLANSTFGVHPGRLTITTVSASGTAMTVEYYVSTSTLFLKENGVDKGSLMSSKSKIDALVFRYINTGNTTGIKIELHVSSSRGKISDVDHFYDTVIMRRTY